jgi:hypothetical protein
VQETLKAFAARGESPRLFFLRIKTGLEVRATNDQVVSVLPLFRRSGRISRSFRSCGFGHQAYLQVHTQCLGHFFQRAQRKVGVETFEAADVSLPGTDGSGQV